MDRLTLTCVRHRAGRDMTPSRFWDELPLELDAKTWRFRLQSGALKLEHNIEQTTPDCRRLPRTPRLTGLLGPVLYVGWQSAGILSCMGSGPFRRSECPAPHPRLSRQRLIDGLAELSRAVDPWDSARLHYLFAILVNLPDDSSIF